ncbi:MAG: Acyl-CoA dehydrogenase C-terminal domain-containing protein, partial [Acidobacteriota bacterium]
DSRITNIYEGTSQLQILAAVRGVCSGAFEKHIAGFEEHEFKDKTLHELKQRLAEGRELVLKGIAFVKERGNEYMDLHGRKLVDSATAVLIGHLFLRQAEANQRKRIVAQRYIDQELPTLRRNIERVCSGDQTPLEHYDAIAGPPVAT